MSVSPAHLRPWLVSVAANEAKQLLRKRQTRAEVEVATDAAQSRVASIRRRA